MEAKEFIKLKQHYYSLLEQYNIYKGLSGGTWINAASFITLDRELANLSQEFSDIIPPYNKDDYFVHLTRNNKPVYDFIGIQTYLASVIGILRTIIDQSASTPITEERQFLFISNTNLRQIIERDYVELQKTYIAGCWKSVLILSGGLIEAILLNLLESKQEDITKCECRPNENDITKWDLASLIKVAVELKLVSSGIEKLSNPIREYRNLIHPGNELRKKLRFGPEEARIAVEVVNMLHRDLTS